MRILDFLSSTFTGKLFSNRELAQVRGEISFPEAIAAHAAWKSHLIEAVTGRSGTIPHCDEVGSDTRCTLGQWIHGAGEKRYGDLSSFVELRTQHARFHDIACDIVELSRAKKMGEARRLMDGEFQKTSTDIILRLKRLSGLFGN